MKTLNTSTVRRAKTPAEVLPVCFRHNLRQDNADHRHRARIAVDRTTLNTVLRGAADLHTLEQTVQDTLDAIGATPPRRDTIMGVEYVCQPPDGVDTPEFWATCLAHIEGRGLPVLHAVVHRDQTRPHMHAIVLALAGGKFVGATMTNGANRLETQRWGFMEHMRTHGMRPDRRPKSSALERLALSTGKGPRRHAEADRRDVALMRRVEVSDGWRPHGPPDLMARDLMAPTSYCARLAALELLHSMIVRVGGYPAAPKRAVTPAPRPLQSPGAATLRCAA